MRQELWYALKRLRARPWHTAIVVGILAIGSGATLTVFRIADAVLLRELPYQHAERLVRLSEIIPVAPTSELPFSDVGFRAVEQRTRAFDMMAGYRLTGVNLTLGNTPMRVMSARVTGNFFDLLGLPAQRGRLFDAGAETKGGTSVIVLSDALWRGSFGADPKVVGTIVRVDGAPATVIGVADARVAFPAATVGFFTVIELDAVGKAAYDFNYEAIARLRSGTTMAAAQREVTRVLRDVARENPGPHRTQTSDVSGFHAVIKPVHDDMVGGIRPTLLLLSSAAAFVLLLTGVNVATLELVRSSARRTELAIRSALGAARPTLIMGAMFEGVAQSLSGVMLGFGASSITVQVLHTLLPESIDATLDQRLSVVMAAAVIVIVLFGAAASAVFPVVMTMRSDLQSALRDRNAAVTRGLSWLRRGLIVTQIAFACVLVYGATLMITTVRNAQRVSLGFRAENTVVFQLSLPRESYGSLTDVTLVYNALVERLRGIPGVLQVGMASALPLDGENSTTMVGVEGRPFKADGTDPNVDVRVISASYFDAMRIRMVSGRGFREGDGYLDGTPVVMSKSMAKLVWPNGTDPIGQRIRIRPFAPWMTVIGVVDDAKNRSVTAVSRPELYVPFGAPRSPIGVTREMSLVIRASGSLASVQRAAQRVAMQLNPDLPLYGMRRLEDVVRQSQQREVITMRTLTVFAAVALVLALTGSYAMLMFAVVQRHRELAVRQAVGATAQNLVRMIGREMGQLLAIGIAAGMIGALLLARLLAGFLFGVTTLDPAVIAATLAIVSMAALLAAVLPAQRASRVDVMSLLRAE